jgi:hypothetical protein
LCDSKLRIHACLTRIISFAAYGNCVVIGKAIFMSCRAEAKHLGFSRFSKTFILRLRRRITLTHTLTGRGLNGLNGSEEAMPLNRLFATIYLFALVHRCRALLDFLG